MVDFLEVDGVIVNSFTIVSGPGQRTTRLIPGILDHGSSGFEAIKMSDEHKHLVQAFQFS